jgi:hypothetical protein
MTEQAEVAPVDLDDLAAIEALEVVEFDDEGAWTAGGDLAVDDAAWDQYPKCPNPTRWRMTGQARADGALRPVSSAVVARDAPLTYRFRVTRSITFGASLESKVSVGIPMLEAETGITLSTSVTITVGETVTFTVPKGHAMALFGGCGYIVRTFSRTVYGSAMCNPVVQTARVFSPRLRILEVRNV